MKATGFFGCLKALTSVHYVILSCVYTLVLWACLAKNKIHAEAFSPDRINQNAIVFHMLRQENGS